MKFKSKEHEQFFYTLDNSCKNIDTYHLSLFYTLGIDKDCRYHINELYNKKNDSIIISGLNQPWQTSGSDLTTRLAFNLWNGYTQDGYENESTPSELFACEYAPYFFEAVKMRYPEYCKEQPYRKNTGKER